MWMATWAEVESVVAFVTFVRSAAEKTKRSEMSRPKNRQKLMDSRFRGNDSRTALFGQTALRGIGRSFFEIRERITNTSG